MCNLYTTPSADEFEQYMKQLDVVLGYDLGEGWPSKPIGPFGWAPFVTASECGLRLRMGQWGLIRPGQPERIGYTSPRPIPGKKTPAPKPLSTNNARIESIDQKPTYVQAWRKGQRCLIPAAWYAEPNWETGKNIWWHLKRADGLPWMLAGLWDEWTDKTTGEVVPNFTMITCNCDGHPLLGRLHKPDPKLPPDQQDKRSLIHLEPGCWDQWLSGTIEDARALIVPRASEFFDQSDARLTDQLLAAQSPPDLFG